MLRNACMPYACITIMCLETHVSRMLVSPSCVGWPEPYIHTVYDRMYGDFPAKNTVYTPYIRMYVWFWPTLIMCLQLHVCVCLYHHHVLGTPSGMPEMDGDGGHILKVDQNHIYSVHIGIFRRGNHQIYGHIRLKNIQFWPTLHILCVLRTFHRT